MLARQIAIGLGIALLFPLVVHYGVRTFGPPFPPAALEQLTTPTGADKRQVLSQAQRGKQEKNAGEAKKFARSLIVFSTPLGIAAIVIGTFLHSPAVGTGLVAGGILTIAHGYWNYWSYADDWVLFVSALAGLGILLLVAYRPWPSLRRQPPPSLKVEH
jgi:hypothetical protein